jgi:hypothetical protein
VRVCVCANMKNKTPGRRGAMQRDVEGDGGKGDMPSSGVVHAYCTPAMAQCACPALLTLLGACTCGCSQGKVLTVVLFFLECVTMCAAPPPVGASPPPPPTGYVSDASFRPPVEYGGGGATLLVVDARSCDRPDVPPSVQVRASCAGVCIHTYIHTYIHTHARAERKFQYVS